MSMHASYARTGPGSLGEHCDQSEALRQQTCWDGVQKVMQEHPSRHDRVLPFTAKSICWSLNCMTVLSVTAHCFLSVTAHCFNDQETLLCVQDTC
jgi:hypothetical protein